MKRITTLGLAAAIYLFHFSAFSQNEDPLKAGDEYRSYIN